MKRIGKLNNKIVVQGDPNLVKSNQILYKEDSSGIVLQERKNNNLENITAGGGSNSDGAFTYKSRKVVWKIIDNEKANSILRIALELLPFYSCIKAYYDAGTNYIKYYGYEVSYNLYDCIESPAYQDISFIEETEGYGIRIYHEIEIDSNKGLIGIACAMNDAEGMIIDENEARIILKENFGIEQIPYEEYLNFKVDYDYKFANF